MLKKKKEYNPSLMKKYLILVGLVLSFNLTNACICNLSHSNKDGSLASAFQIGLESKHIAEGRVEIDEVVSTLQMVFVKKGFAFNLLHEEGLESNFSEITFTPSYTYDFAKDWQASISYNRVFHRYEDESEIGR